VLRQIPGKRLCDQAAKRRRRIIQAIGSFAVQLVLDWASVKWFMNAMDKSLLQRITRDPLIMSGNPCIRGMRITVASVLRLLAVHHDSNRILQAYPELEPEDIDACLQYAACLAEDYLLEHTA